MSYGTATTTFTRVDAEGKRHWYDVVLDLKVPVTPENLDGGELAWEAASEWPESGWGSDDPRDAWGVVKVMVTIDGEATDITPREVIT